MLLLLLVVAPWLSSDLSASCFFFVSHRPTEPTGVSLCLLPLLARFDRSVRVVVVLSLRFLALRLSGGLLSLHRSLCAAHLDDKPRAREL